MVLESNYLFGDEDFIRMNILGDLNHGRILIYPALNPLHYNKIMYLSGLLNSKVEDNSTFPNSVIKSTVLMII